MKKARYLGIAFLIVFTLAACAPGPNPQVPAETGEPAGFWLGLWHGFITPFTFIISLFNRNINIYEVANNGGWYNFGYVFGLSIILGGSSGSACRRSKRKSG